MPVISLMNQGTDILFLIMKSELILWNTSTSGRSSGRCFREPFSQVVTIDLLPVDPGDKPVKFVGSEVPGGVICTWPAEAAFVKTAGTQPHPVFIPSQHFDTRTGFVDKDEGGTLMPRRPEFILYILRQRVDAASHIDGFNSEEDIIRPEHI